MADRISDLAIAQALAGTELMEVSQDVGGSLSSRQLALSVLLGWFKANGIKHHVDTRDPTVNDDETQGFSGVGPESSGSIWVNESGDGEIFRCTSAAAGAARWINTSLTLDELGSMAVVDDAPSDGEIHARKDGAWAQLGSGATADQAAFPFTNLIGYGGRQADMSANTYGMFTQQVSSSPFDFTSSWMFYNGATVSEAGKFIHNNDDFGGNLGSMTQTTIDLINAMGRTGTYARYGIEFYIAELSCVGGTANELLSTGLYLALGNGSKFIFSASSFSTFTGWVRAVDGDAALFGNPHSEGDVREINGVPHLSPNYYILTPAEGWVFMRYVRVAPQGYDASFPRFYGERNVTKIQIACPAFFCGAVDPGIYTAPLLSAGSME